MANRPKMLFAFQTSATATGNGNVLLVNEAESVKLFFTLSGTFTAYFEDSSDGTTFFPIQAFNNTSKTLVNYTSDATATYTVDLTGSNYFRVRISSISGTLSCNGRVVY